VLRSEKNITGLRRPEDTAVLQNVLNPFKEAGITCLDKPKVAITSIVCSYDPGFPLNLVRIAMALMDHERVEYESEAFPTLVCRISDPKIVFLLFLSGTIIITGGKTMDDGKAGLDILMEKLSVMDNKFQRIQKLPAEVWHEPGTLKNIVVPLNEKSDRVSAPFIQNTP